MPGERPDDRRVVDAVAGRRDAPLQAGGEVVLRGGDPPRPVVGADRLSARSEVGGRRCPQAGDHRLPHQAAAPATPGGIGFAAQPRVDEAHEGHVITLGDEVVLRTGGQPRRRVAQIAERVERVARCGAAVAPDVVLRAQRPDVQDVLLRPLGAEVVPPPLLRYGTAVLEVVCSMSVVTTVRGLAWFHGWRAAGVTAADAEAPRGTVPAQAIAAAAAMAAIRRGRPVTVPRRSVRSAARPGRSAGRRGRPAGPGLRRVPRCRGPAVRAR